MISHDSCQSQRKQAPLEILDLRRWWEADVIERIGLLYGRKIGGRETYHDTNYFSHLARSARFEVVAGEVDTAYIYEPTTRAIAHTLKHALGDGGYATQDMDLWEWAYFRLEWLEECYMACEWRLWGLLYAGMCPMSEPDQIKIARLRF